MCDLPIAGFKFADDNESFLLSDIVEAIRIKHPDFVITDTICESVIRHGDIKTAYTIHSVCLYGEIVVHPNFVMKITKKEAIRLYALMFDDIPMIKQEEPEVKQLPKSERRLETMRNINKQYPHLQTKREVYEKCKEVSPDDFSMTQESFGEGGGCIWRKAKAAGITWAGIC